MSIDTQQEEEKIGIEREIEKIMKYDTQRERYAVRGEKRVREVIKGLCGTITNLTFC